MSDSHNQSKGPKAPLNETARSEIELAIEKEKQLQELDAQWKKERETLAHKPTHELSFDIGGVSMRSVQAEYTQRREQHKQREDAIEREFSKSREAVRDQGTTISDTFEKSRSEKRHDDDPLSHRFNNSQDRGRRRS